MKKTTKRKLALGSEAVKALTIHVDLRNVHGGLGGCTYRNSGCGTIVQAG
jgi:hypothetical protein